MPTTGDGCSSECTIEPAWYCNNTACGQSSCFVICGDGLKGGGELDDDRCDDENLNNGDGCDSSCHIECGWTCEGEDLEQDVCSTHCGDGLLAGVYFRVSFESPLQWLLVTQPPCVRGVCRVPHIHTLAHTMSCTS
jgi:cysteine-rich repeat protein